MTLTMLLLGTVRLALNIAYKRTKFDLSLIHI